MQQIYWRTGRIEWHPIRDESNYPPELHKSYLITVDNKDCPKYCHIDSLAIDGNTVRWNETISEDVVAWAELPAGISYGDDVSTIKPWRKPRTYGLSEYEASFTGMHQDVHWNLCDRFAPMTWPEKDGAYLATLSTEEDCCYATGFVRYTKKDGWHLPHSHKGAVLAWADCAQNIPLLKTLFRRAKEDKERNK